MTPLQEKLDVYHLTGKYKGFYELLRHEMSNTTHLTLTDGEHDISASGTFTGEALQRIFDKIDKVRSN